MFSLKSFFTVGVILVSALGVLAQTANIKDIPADQESTTTISISKGDKKTSNQFEIADGQSDVLGEPEALLKEARASWRQACNDWKKEFREWNKDQSIINMNCGQPACEKTSMAETQCKSQASYKVRVKLR
jgi:hypothetical protein